MTDQELREIMTLTDLAGWISYLGCGGGQSLSCYACDPNLRAAVAHMQMYLSDSEREVIFRSVCGCGVKPPPPQTPSLPSPQSGPAPVPTTPPATPVVVEEKCPETLPAAGTYTGGSTSA